MVPMVTIVKTNVASTVEFQGDVTGWQGGVRESAKWGGKDRLVILVRLFSPCSNYGKKVV